MAHPILPLTPATYTEYRRELWSRRGPNVQTCGDGTLLPCYQVALSRLGALSANKETVSSTAPPPNGGPPASGPATAPPLSARSSATAAPHQRVLDVMRRGVEAGTSEPFYVVDLHAALEKLAIWRALLPDIEPFYAVKCNGDAALLLTLANAGVGFDCASEAEISAVMRLGVPAARLLYANPIKQPSHLKHACNVGVPLTVFDGEPELRKLAAVHPSCGLLLRIVVDDSQAQCVLSNKYGAQPKDAAALLAAAAELGLRVVGVSFHVGSGSSSANVFRDAVADAAAIFDLAAARGTPMSILDVGGGFPGVDSSDMSFAAMAGALSTALAEHFPRDPQAKRGGVRLIAEPGRFFACATHHLAVAVIGKKVVPLPADSKETTAKVESAVDVSDALSPPAAPARRSMYYINDGLYGSFNCVLYDHATPTCEVVVSGSAQSPAEPLPCSVWGPTCDGIDCVLADATLPELEVGAWLAFRDMGAYTSCAGSNFNGMALPDVVYLQAQGGPSPQAPAAAAEQMLRQMGCGAFVAA